MLKCHRITNKQIKRAHKSYLKNEPRNLFYRLAIHLVKEALNGKGRLNLAEAVSILLQTWNRRYYQHFKFTNEHLSQIGDLLSHNRRTLARYERRNINSLKENENVQIKSLFKEFELVLGPVGAAKVLYLFAPKFFSLWDNKIANKYGHWLSRRGTNARKYFEFMLCQKKQSAAIECPLPDNITTLKSIDEYNYCKFTSGLNI